MHRLSTRVLDAFLLLWLVSTITFALIHLAPGDPATLLISPTASAEEAARQRTALGLDAPLALQYARWIGGVLRGELGESLVRAEPVTRVIADALPVSLFLGGVSLLASFVLGTMLGMLQALRTSQRADRVITALMTTIYAAPSFWLALAMVTLFTSGVVWLGLPASMRLPAFGMQDPAADPAAFGWADRWRHAVLPLLVLSLPGAAGVSRFARRALLEAAGAPHVQAAYARGLTRGEVERAHILRNALTPLVVLFGLTLPGVIAGSVFVEQVFAWPGLGRAMLSAIAARDYPVVLGLTLVYAGGVVSANLLADLILLRLDPRRRTT
ncbi:ABC transporter permease [Gemmatimonas groenlandica]|uniref:ABC transporter permease n=1 Tax=Gemmatimonas groenlandica TaxID=2732249 RepID=A0A6M4II40_9BACT|nr:ABC transporter permease [Gemmatimonas groenlandica]QJR34764.1 ABC transporter permease [Gemmatimonas groenlandica]